MSLPKMFLISGKEDFKKLSATLPKSGTALVGLKSAPMKSEQRTKENGSGYSRGGLGIKLFLPRTVKSATAAESHGAKLARSIMQNVIASGRIQKMSGSNWRKKLGGLLPTLTCQDAKNNGGPAQYRRNTLPLNALFGGRLNPEYCDWFMGWPIGWSGLEPLATARFQEWSQKHGEL